MTSSDLLLAVSALVAAMFFCTHLLERQIMKQAQRIIDYLHHRDRH